MEFVILKELKFSILLTYLMYFYGTVSFKELVHTIKKRSYFSHFLKTCFFE